MKAVRFLALVVLVSRVAAAEPTSEERRTGAETLFLEGRRLMTEGKPAEACPKFAESQKLDPGIGTLLNLARCYDRIGRTASAWAAYRDAAGQARATGQSVREAAARAEADRLEPALARVEIRLTEGASAQEVSLVVDDKPWSGALIGVGTPLDPGAHTLTAKGAGLRPWTTRFEASPSSTVRVQVPALTPLPMRRVASPSPRPEPWRWTHTVAVSAATVGIAAVATGIVWGLDARATYDRSGPYCNAREECQPEGLGLREDAFDRARLSTVAFSVGGAALVSAAVLWFTRRTPDALPWASPSARGSVTPPAMGVRF